MLQRTSDQHKINFLSQEKKQQFNVIKEDPIESKNNLSELINSQKAKKLNSKFDEPDKMSRYLTSHSIASARTGEILDEGGPSKFIKSETSNTVFENNKTEKLSIDNKTKTIQEKQKIADNKRLAEEKRMIELAESLKQSNITKSSTISPMNSLRGSKYNMPQQGISIFDSGDFERVAEETDGERVKNENIKKNSQKDDSWRNGGKSKSTKESVENYFQNIFNKTKE